MLTCRPIAANLAAVAAVSLLTAGCGGGSAKNATPGGTQRSTLAYALCMHSHGVPDFPDPDRNGGIDKNKVIALGNPPQLGVASNACQHLMPTSGLGPGGSGPPPQTRFADLLALARCLRSHGFPKFPDPTRSGQLTPAMVVAAGVDLHQPALKQAADGCVGVTHGALTKASVARFVAGQ